MLGIGRSRAYEMIREGQLPIVRLGRSVRVPADKLREWIETNTDAPAHQHQP